MFHLIGLLYNNNTETILLISNVSGYYVFLAINKYSLLPNNMS